MRAIIIGGNPAGLSAASAIRKGYADWEIDVYEKGEYISYGSCGIPYFVANEVKSLDNLMTLTQQTLKEKRNIPVHIFHEVIKVDFENKLVYVKDVQNQIEFTKEYDYLIITTGGESNTQKISVSETVLQHPRVFKVHTLAHAKRLKEFLTSTPINEVVVIGSGYIGLEMLEAYEAQGVQNITIIGPRLNFRSQSQEYIQKELEKHNVKIILENRVTSIEILSETQLKVILKDGQTLTTEAVQLSIGVLPATKMFDGTQLSRLSNGAIIVDEFGRTNLPNVFAAGDCATSYHNLLKKNVYIPLAPTANKQGRIVGSHIAGKAVYPFPGVYGTAIFKVFDLYCATTGITEGEAQEIGYDVAKILITNNEIAHYYPDAQKMSILLRFDKQSHVLLGAEITAPSTLGAKKIDVFATALSAGMKIEDLQKLDLAYAPPFAPVWDPVLIAANIARKKCL